VTGRHSIAGFAAALVLAAPSLTACGTGHGYDPAATSKQIDAAVAAGLFLPRVTVESTLPHPTDARTEGLEVYDGMIYEGTGPPGRSELRESDARTGGLARATPLPEGLQGGGITVIGSLVWQLTRRGGVALQWNRGTLNAGGRVPWAGAGDGLCHDEDRLIASDGSNRLRVFGRNGTDTGEVIDVRLLDEPLAGLAELECTSGAILANVSGTAWIVVIDPRSGVVRAAIDLSPVVPAEVRDDPAKAANGIALLPGTESYLVTGRSWPSLARVRFTLY